MVKLVLRLCKDAIPMGRDGAGYIHWSMTRTPTSKGKTKGGASASLSVDSKSNKTVERVGSGYVRCASWKNDAFIGRRLVVEETMPNDNKKCKIESRKKII